MISSLLHSSSSGSAPPSPEFGEEPKIDRAFVRGVAEHADDTTIVSTIISLAQALRLKVIAEGLETEQQAHLLRLLRCDQMQGYLFSPPVPQDKVEAMLRAPAA